MIGGMGAIITGGLCLAFVLVLSLWQVGARGRGGARHNGMHQGCGSGDPRETQHPLRLPPELCFTIEGEGGGISCPFEQAERLPQGLSPPKERGGEGSGVGNCETNSVFGGSVN